ncbi:hypothetical protein ABPG75_000102 [Micractinium tetrahymenae]
MSASVSTLQLQWRPEVATHPTLDAQMLELDPLEVDEAASAATGPPPRRLLCATATANRFQGGGTLWRLPQRWRGIIEPGDHQADTQLLDLGPLELDAAVIAAAAAAAAADAATAPADLFQGGGTLWRLPRHWLVWLWQHGLEPLELDVAASGTAAGADFPPRRLRCATAVANRFRGGGNVWRLPQRWLAWLSQQDDPEPQAGSVAIKIAGTPEGLALACPWSSAAGLAALASLAGVALALGASIARKP